MTFQYFLFDTYLGMFIMALPLAIIVSVIYGIVKFKNNKEMSLFNKVVQCMFVCYLVGLIELVICLDLMRYIWYWIIYHMDGGNTIHFFEFSINIIPDFWKHLNGESIGNLLMFIPFGILYSASKKEYNFKKSILAGFIFSLEIEIVQPIFGRAFDINDLILNTVGSIIGVCIFYIVKKLLKK